MLRKHALPAEPSEVCTAGPSALKSPSREMRKEQRHYEHLGNTTSLLRFVVCITHVGRGLERINGSC